MIRPARTFVALALAGLVGVLGVSGCSSDGNSIADQARSGNQAGFIAGDGSIEKLPVDKRGAPVALSGTLLDGKPWSMQQAAGKVLVVNVWGSWCVACEEETPHLVAAAKQFAGNAKVAFLGIDVGESAVNGAAAAERHGLPYPSLSDRDRATGAVLQNKAEATPTTLVLDPQGRIAARISGAITTPSTLTGLVQDVLTENA